MSNQNGTSDGILILQNKISRMMTATKYWAVPVFLGTKFLWLLSIFYMLFLEGKSGYGFDYFRYYSHNFLIYLNEKYPDTCVTFLNMADKYIRPQSFLDSLQDSDPEAITEALWFVKTTHSIWLSTEFFFAATIGLACTALYIGKRVYEQQTGDKYIRGTVKTIPKLLSKMMKKDLGAGTLKIGEVEIPYTSEVESFLFLAKSGSGKTCHINLMLQDALRRPNTRCITLALKEGDFMSPFADLTKDLIYCPSDLRSIKWSFMRDITDISAFPLISNILFPPDTKSTGPWLNGARLITEKLLVYAYVKGIKSTKTVYEDIFSNPKGAAAWHEYLLETPGGGTAAGLLAQPDSLSAYGFYLTVLVGIMPLEIMAKNDGDFSIREYMKDPNAGNLFITTREDYSAMLAPAQQLFLEIIMINHLSMGQDINRRIFYFLDELPNLPFKIMKLQKLAAVARGLGSSIVIGAQSYLDIDSVYGEPARRSICNNCNIKALMCIADSQTAKESSDTIGTAEFESTRQTVSTNINDHGANSNMTEKKEITVVMPSELTNLKKFETYVHVPGYGVAKTKTKYTKNSIKNAPKVNDPDYNLSRLDAKYAEMAQKKNNYLANIAVEDAKLAEDVAVMQKSAQPTITAEKSDELRWQQAITLINTDEDMGMF